MQVEETEVRTSSMVEVASLKGAEKLYKKKRSHGFVLCAQFYLLCKCRDSELDVEVKSLKIFNRINIYLHIKYA